MNDSGPGRRPDYKVHRARRRPFGSLGSSGDLEGMRERLRRRSEGGGRDPSGPRQITPGRVLRWLALAIVGWLALSFVLFMASAQLEGGVSDNADNALSGGGSFFSGQTTLVLGSDERKGDSIDETSSGPGRADSIMLVHTALGGVNKLSIPRDTAADIPGNGVQKINGAYSIGGPALMIRTVEGFLGNELEIDHLIEVDFEAFPAFIDSLGGITVKNKSRICAPAFDNFFRGFKLPKGEQELDGRRALGFARVRKNDCAPAENDIDRAARQQEVLSGIRGSLLSPGTFFRLPLVSWRAPQTINSDMKGLGLLGLAADIATGGTGETRVLEPFAFNADGTLAVSDAEKSDAVEELTGN